MPAGRGRQEDDVSETATTAPAPVALPGWDLDGGCRAKRGTSPNFTPCPDPARWSLVLDCPHCGALGSGVACDFHKEQAEEWGVPHVADGQRCHEAATVVSAVRL
jgi:hypothetical protein